MIDILLLLMFTAPLVFSFPVTIIWTINPNFARKLQVLPVFGLFISLCISLYILFNVSGTYEYRWLSDYNINFVFIFDYLSKYMGVLTAFIAFLISIYSLEYMKYDYRLGWYWFFFNMFTTSMLIVAYSNNLLLLLIGWEGLSLASWALIGHWFRDDLSYVGIMGRRVGPLKMYWPPSIGGWRAISTIRLGDMPMFFAIAAIYALTGNLNISQINWAELFNEIGFTGTVILFIALLMGPFTKSAQLPFNEWLMTAMTGPTTVSALLHSATMVAAGAYLFMRLSWYIEPWNLNIYGLEVVYSFVLFLGLISALYGALVALGCLERKVLLAASTMSSLGLIFACSAASFWVGKLAIIVAFWYLVIHAFAKATLFLVAGHLIHATDDRFCCGNLELARKMKMAFIATIIATLSLSGIPPFTAYWVKSAMDMVMHDLHEIALWLLILTSIIYSAFLAKFLSLNFIKGVPKHPHLHGELLMPTIYISMVLILILLSYPTADQFIKAGFKKSSIIVGIAILTSYLIALVIPRVESPIGKFLGDRMYMSALNDLIIPRIGWITVKAVDYGNKFMDFLFHQNIPKFMSICSIKIRTIQSGYLKRYIKIVLGIVMVILVALSFMGW